MQNDEGYGRRAALRAIAGAVGLGVAAAAGAADLCYDPARLSAAERSMRQALNYKDRSPDPKRACGGCAFFTAASPATCGRCQMLSGGPVTAASVCDSWTARG